MFGLSF